MRLTPKILVTRSRSFLKPHIFFPYSCRRVLSLAPGGGGGTLYDGLYGEAPPDRGIFFRLEVYERVEISLAEVYKRVGEKICHLGLWKLLKGLTDEFYGFIKSRKRSIFVIDSYLKHNAFKTVKKYAKF